MTKVGSVIVAGTDTGVGKTVVSAVLMKAWGASYYKPIQCGLELDEFGQTDTERVRMMTGFAPSRFFKELYCFRAPVSPHRACELEGKTIDIEQLKSTPRAPTLLIEAAGGLLVPLNPRILQIDLFRDWGFPVVLVSRTTLGTINHTLLSIEALKSRAIPTLGVIFVGDQNQDTENTICKISGVSHLGRIPWMRPVSSLAIEEAAKQMLWESPL